jgi:LPXTG-site transpeptidase (sortase) family protein
MSGRLNFKKVRFFGTSGILYVLSIVCVWYAARPLQPVAAQVVSFKGTPSAVQSASGADLVVGRPNRIVIPSEDVDLPVDQGFYDSADASWTLNGYRAQFDMASSPANNYGGETFIYGHNNDYVFGALRHHAPAPGALALLYTVNGHVFAYRFTRSWSLTPDDVSVLNYQGSPVLLIQTCTGSLNEWRTMYLFTFDKVVK